MVNLIAEAVILLKFLRLIAESMLKSFLNLVKKDFLVIDQ